MEQAMVAHAYSLEPGRARQEDCCKFKESLSYSEIMFQKAR